MCWNLSVEIPVLVVWITVCFIVFAGRVSDAAYGPLVFQPLSILLHLRCDRSVSRVGSNRSVGLHRAEWVGQRWGWLGVARKIPLKPSDWRPRVKQCCEINLPFPFNLWGRHRYWPSIATMSFRSVTQAENRTFCHNARCLQLGKGIRLLRFFPQGWSGN